MTVPNRSDASSEPRTLVEVVAETIYNTRERRDPCGNDGEPRVRVPDVSAAVVAVMDALNEVAASPSLHEQAEPGVASERGFWFGFWHPFIMFRRWRSTREGNDG